MSQALHLLKCKMIKCLGLTKHAQKRKALALKNLLGHMDDSLKLNKQQQTKKILNQDLENIFLK